MLKLRANILYLNGFFCLSAWRGFERITGIAIEVALVVAIPAPSGIGVGKPAGAVAFEFAALAGFPPVMGRAGFNASAVAGDVDSIWHEAQFDGTLYADLGENFLKQAFWASVEAAAFQYPVNKHLNGTFALKRHLVLAVIFDRLTLFAFYARFFLNFDKAIHEVIVGSDSRKFAQETAGNLQDTIPVEFLDPIVKRVSQIAHQDKRTENLRLVFRRSAGFRV